MPARVTQQNESIFNLITKSPFIQKTVFLQIVLQL